ncbi:MAG: DALR anticodon-binding domain-containing protein, partial [Candidatus Bipolaricaulia bacterium]
KPEAHLEFDLDLARSESRDNPATYVQYAHTRISSIFRKAGDDWTASATPDLSLLVETEELDLIKALDRFPEVVETAALSFAPHLVADFALQLSRAFHAYYDRHRILSDDAGLTRARLALLRGLQVVLRESLDILGMSVPKEM